MILDGSCSVTVGNQTALVRPDGSFQLRNISIFRSRDTGIAPQLYRVRATCLRDGEMITGQSEFISLIPGQTVFITSVFPTALDPIPTGIAVSSPIEFVPQGETAQLTVVATLPDGSSEDVTPRASGTTYLSTNPRLLTVSDNGLVTGVSVEPSFQTVTVAVLHEGNLATINLTAVGPSNDFDNDGMPNDYEELFGLNPFVDDSGGDLDGDGLTNLDEFQLGTLPNNPDTDGDGVPDGLDGDPLRPEESPPTVTILSPVAGDTLTEGESLILEAEATDDGLLTGVEFRVNGANLGTDDEPPFELTLMVPLEASALSFEARATDGVGNVGAAETTSSVIDDPLTTVTGQVVDVDAMPVEGADVVLELRGLKGEFFDFAAPLSTFPDLTGLTPDAIALVASLNLRNPDNLLSPDTFGLGFSPDFAARFSGRLRLTEPGSHTFVLGADDGARLSIAGVPVLEVLAGGDFSEASVTVDLPDLETPIEIEYFQATGDAELRLAVISPGDTDARVLVAELEQDPPPFSATSAADGTFGIASVPTVLGALRAKASLVTGSGVLSGSSGPAAPVPGGVTDLGPIEIAIPTSLYAAGNNVFDSFSDLFEVDPSTGQATGIGPLRLPPGRGSLRLLGGMDSAAGGTLFGVGLDNAERMLFVGIDPVTGDVTVVGPTGNDIGFFETVTDVSFRPADGSLFAHWPLYLATIDLSTGAAIRIGRTGLVRAGLAFAPDGTLLAADHEALYSVSQATGAADVIRSLSYPSGVSFPEVTAMDFHPQAGTLFAVITWQDRADIFNPVFVISLVTIDPTTGEVARVGDISRGEPLHFFEALAWGPAR